MDNQIHFGQFGTPPYLPSLIFSPTAQLEGNLSLSSLSTCLSLSLFLSFIFFPSLFFFSFLFPPTCYLRPLLFDLRRLLGPQCAPATEEAQSSMARSLKFQSKIISRVGHVRPWRVHLLQSFIVVSTPSDGIFRRYQCHSNQHSTNFKTVPLSSNKSSPLGSESLFPLCLPRPFWLTGATLWGETSKNVTYSPRAFIWDIYSLCLVKVSKITFYETKLLIWVHSRLLVGPTETQNQKLRPLPNLFWRHDSSGRLTIFKWASIQSVFFEVSSVSPFYMKV